MTTGFGQRPGGEPVRGGLTAADMEFRAQFDVRKHFAQQNGAQPSATSPQSPADSPPQIPTVDLEQIRANLRKIGMDFQLFMIGDVPVDPSGRAQYREARLIELEASNKTLHERSVTAEATAAMAVRELTQLKDEVVKLHTELETLRSAPDTAPTSQQQETT